MPVQSTKEGKENLRQRFGSGRVPRQQTQLPLTRPGENEAQGPHGTFVSLLGSPSGRVQLAKVTYLLPDPPCSAHIIPQNPENGCPTSHDTTPILFPPHWPDGHVEVDMHFMNIPKGHKHHYSPGVNEVG